MRFAVISDVHANLPALRATLDDIARRQCDRIYFLGDAIDIGPFPAETLDLLLATPNLIALRGNHDDWFARGIPTHELAMLASAELVHYRWTWRQLDQSLRTTLGAWPWRIDVTIGGCRVAFMHYAMRADGQGVIDAVHPPAIAAMEAAFAADLTPPQVVFHGHDHIANDRVGPATGVRFMNPGALGCSKGLGVGRWLVCEPDNAGALRVEPIETRYERDALLAAFRERNVPDATALLRDFFGVPAIAVRRVPVDAILPLRHRVLRAGLPFDAARLEGDDAPGTLHLAAVDTLSQAVVGCGTIVREPWNARPAWRLRGMAVDPAQHRRGVGRLVLEALEAHVRQAGGSLIWCHARTPAVPFYRRLGWDAAGEEFDIPTAGPHFKMFKALRRSPPAARK